MATKKDLVEAYSFSRRRLVTAFVSGAPGGREVEPARPGRTIIGGVALAVLLMAGAAIAGVFSPRTTVDWDEPAFLVAEDTGSIYVIVPPRAGDDEPALRPVTNPVSAQLILGPGTEPISVPVDEIRDQPTGPTIGILGAPATVPPASSLIGHGWTACTDDGRGIKTHVSRDPQVTPTPGAGFVVRSGGKHYLVAEAPGTEVDPPRAYRYRVPGDNPSLNDAIGVPLPESAAEVPDEWLALFDSGGSLDGAGFGLERPGRRPDFPGSDRLPAKVRVGDYYQDGVGTKLVTDEGPASVPDFAAAVLAETRFDGYRPKEVPAAADADVPVVSPPEEIARWPAGRLGPPAGELCAQLLPSEEGPPRVVVAQAPVGAASAEALPPDRRDVTVESGHGALVLSGGWSGGRDGQPFLVDDRGIAYPLAGMVTAGQLGYDADDVVAVPSAWVDLFDEGVELSQDAALCPPDAEQGRPSCD